MNWIKPPWRDEEYEGWPWVGDQFLAAVAICDKSKRGWSWDYHVLTWSETGLECQRECWSAWGESDIEWIAKIPEPSDTV